MGVFDNKLLLSREIKNIAKKYYFLAYQRNKVLCYQNHMEKFLTSLLFSRFAKELTYQHFLLTIKKIIALSAVCIVLFYSRIIAQKKKIKHKLSANLN